MRLHSLFFMLYWSRKASRPWVDIVNKKVSIRRKHSKKCTFYTLRFGCSFAAVNTIKPQLL